MTRAPVVSVVMIFKDVQPFLAEAVASVLAQTWTSLELLLVDDGGTDGSAEVAAALVRQDSDRVHLLHHPDRANLGMSASRARGIAAATGELVAFLDGDDVWEPGHLEHEVGLLAASAGADMVCGRALLWRSWRDPDARDELTPLPAPPGVVVAPPRLLTAVLRNGAVRTPTCSLLVRTGVLRASGGPVTAFRGMYEDQVLLARLQVRVAAVISGATTARYRQHDASATAVARAHDGRQGRPSGPPARQAYLSWLRTLPELAPECIDTELRAALEQAERAGRPAEPPALARRALLAGRRRVPPAVRRRVREAVMPSGQGRVRLGSLSRVEPLSRAAGSRGQPVDHAYVAAFLDRWAADVRGRVLEVTAGLPPQVSAASPADELVVVPVEDLAAHVEAAQAPYDCVVAAHALQLLDDPVAAVRALHVLVRPGGTLLMTLPGLAPARSDGRPSQWAATTRSLARLLGALFPAQDVDVDARGNVLAAVAVLHGLSADEVGRGRLQPRDPDYPVVLTARAHRPAGPSDL